MNEARRITVMEDVAIRLQGCGNKLESIGHDRLARITKAVASRVQNEVDEYDEELTPPTEVSKTSAEIIIFQPRKSDV